MNIMVTGGNGYVGRTVCRSIYNDHHVCVMDNLRYGEMRFSQAELTKLRFEQGDIRDSEFVSTIVEDFQPDVIIHLAAIHYIPECEQNPGAAVSTNVTGTVNLLAACPEKCRFVFTSSGAVYEPQADPHVEDESPIKPSDIYGFTKLHGEDFVRYIAGLRGFPAVIVRLFNVVGPGETNPHVLPEIVAQLKAGQTTLRLGKLSPQRDYIGVQDAAAGFIAVALAGEVPSGAATIVNLGTQVTHSVQTLLDLLKSVAQINFDVQTDSARLRRVDRPVLAADRSKIKELFDWEPVQTLEDVLQEMWLDPDLPDSLIQKYQL